MLFILGNLVGSSVLSAPNWMPQPMKNPRIPKVQLLYEAKSYPKAMEELRGAVGVAGNSDQEKLWLSLMEGAIHAEQGSTTRALEAFKRGLSAAPSASLPMNSAKAVELFGRAQREMKEDVIGKISEDYRALRYEDALKAIKKAEKIPTDDKEKVWLLLMTGLVQTELTKQGEALDAFVAALDLEQEATLPVESSPKALTLFKRAPAELPSYRERRKKELTTLTLTAYGEKRYPDVLEMAARFKRLHGLSPQDSAWAELMEGVAQGELGNLIEAEKAFDRGLAIASEMGIPVPTSAEVLKAFERSRSTQRKKQLLRDAERAFLAKQYDEALIALVKAEQASALSNSEKLWNRLLKGQVLTELNRPAEAVSAFRDVLSIDPQARLVMSPSPEQRKLFDRARYELRHPLQPLAWIAGGVGAAVIGGGALCLVQARVVEQRLRSSDPNITSVQQRLDIVQSGQAFQTSGWTLFSAGMVGIAAGAGLFLYETVAPGDGHASVVVTPQSAMVGMTWSLP
jgi:tetratricopeptide (TPR) repeat protein